MSIVHWAVVTVLLVGCSQHVGAGHFVNEWTAEIPGGPDTARAVASQHGYTLDRELHSFPDHYILHRSDTPHRSRRSADHHTKKLVEDTRVTFVQQQHAKDRAKRELTTRDLARAIVQTEGGHLDDPSYDKEWYLNPEDDSRRSQGHTDLRVRETWKRGITGKNVVVTILDDGIEGQHPDLAPNYDPDASHDYNDNDRDPTPRYEETNENKHGTRCAGEVAMVANNNKCGVGVAFDSKIGGVRMLDGKVTDRVEAESLSFNLSHVDIFSASWGPTDDGTKLEGPSTLAANALLKGITEGRGGKGVIYAWASGNGGRSNDNCNSDGYSSSIYTIAVNSGSQTGYSPWYSEKCASTLTTSYSSGTSGEQQVISTDLHGLCTDTHTGTSAAAPMAAGLIALLLEANPDLTWRDVQHIVVHTSRKEPLENEKGWYTNAAGYCVNLAFGFGLLDALGMVELAQKDKWVSVGKQRVCTVEATTKDQFPQTLTSGNFIELEFTTDGCEGQDNEVNFLEHVVLNLNLTYPQRGLISAELESPSGTIVTMMLERSNDRSKDGFNDWPLMSVHTWGEKPEGTWKFRVMDKNEGDKKGELKNATLILYGTKKQPEYQKNNPKKCGAVRDVQKTSQPEEASKSVDKTVNDVEQLLKTDAAFKLQSKLDVILKESKLEKEPTYLEEARRILEEFGY